MPIVLHEHSRDKGQYVECLRDEKADMHIYTFFYIIVLYCTSVAYLAQSQYPNSSLEKSLGRLGRATHVHNIRR